MPTPVGSTTGWSRSSGRAATIRIEAKGSGSGGIGTQGGAGGAPSVGGAGGLCSLGGAGTTVRPSLLLTPTLPLPDKHDKESADDKSSTDGDGAIVVRTLVPRDEGMALLVVALPAPIVVAAALIETGADRQQFRDTRPECGKCSGKNDRHAKQLKQVKTSVHRPMMVVRAFINSIRSIP